VWHRQCGASVFGEDAVRKPAEETESVVGNAGQRANLICARHMQIVSWNFAEVTELANIF
jgi:hypothetical protein